MSEFKNTDVEQFHGVWVFCEQRGGALMPTDLELISEGRKLADELSCELCGVLLGDKVEGIAKELGGYGADKVLVCIGRQPDTAGLHLEKAGLIAYSHGLYQKLGEVMGFFGWSVAREDVFKRRMSAYR